MSSENEKRLDRCRDCICLVEEEDGEWWCDECQLPCVEVENCPEQGG